MQTDTAEKIKEGTLQVEQGSDALTVVLGKDKGGYARGVGNGVTFKRYFDLPRSRQSSDARVASLEAQLDNEKRERQEKEKEVDKLSQVVSETQGLVAQLMAQLVDQGKKIDSLSTQSQMPASQAIHFLKFC